MRLCHRRRRVAVRLRAFLLLFLPSRALPTQMHFSRRPPQRVRGTAGPTNVALCRRYIWVTTQSAALQPPSFSPLSAPIPVCVHSTRLMVCVIHSDCLTTSHLFALPECACVCRVCVHKRECIGKKNKERKGEREER